MAPSVPGDPFFDGSDVQGRIGADIRYGLRGTAVLRWEYRPGSRVYLVWQQRRQSRELLGRFDLTRDARAMFEAPGEHVFTLKVDYWLDF